MRSVVHKASSSGVKVYSAIDRKTVLNACRNWARSVRATHSSVVRIGMFGSYAREDYAPGSDVDLLVVIAGEDERPWFMRGRDVDTSGLPLGADVFVYTEDEAARMEADNPWFRRILTEMIWVWGEGT
jgi:predicted nucleotidyltransferase